MANSNMRPYTGPMKLFAGTAAAALLIGWAAGVNAQTTTDSPPAQQASLPAPGTTATPPSIPLGRDDVREVQNQLISLGFDPGPADGQPGPATIAAAQHYDQNRGGNGQVSIDAEFLARLKADTAPRLTYDQVIARSQGHARSQAQSSASAPAANQFGNVVQQIAPLLGAVISNANSNNNNGGYGPGYYGRGPGYYGQGPGYYGPGPGYYGYRSGYGGY